MDKPIAIVTGGAGGLGQSTIDYLNDHGWRTISFDIEKPQSSKASLAIRVDVSSQEQVESAMLQAFGEFPAIDALVCFAGIVRDGAVVGIQNKTLKAYPLSDWNETIGVNLTGTFLCARQYALECIKRREKGTIITVSSPAASGALGQAAYAASKGGVESFTVSLAKELVPWKIRVCGIRPALTQTPMANRYPKATLSSILDKSLIGRYATNREIAEAIDFLLRSDLAQGKIYSFDGGLDL